MIWIYISKSLDSLELKIEEFLKEFQKGNLLHIKRADFEIVKSSLTQSHLFSEYTHFIFEDYIGEIVNLELLFNSVNFNKISILVTIHTENRIFLSWELIKKLEDKNYWLYNLKKLEREKYLEMLLKKKDIELSLENIDLLKEEVLFSFIQLRGVIEQLKILSSSGEKLTKEIVMNSIKSNRVFEDLENPFTFLELYMTNQIRRWVFLLRKMSKSRESLLSFLKCFSYSLNTNFWKSFSDPKISIFIRELSYNFLIFMEISFFRIKGNCNWLIFYFFWENRPALTFEPIFLS